MFNLQGSEIIFILLLALVVLGPEKLPSAIRRFTQTYGELRKMGTGFQSELKSALDEPMREMKETAGMIRDQADPSKIAADADREAMAAERTAQRDLEAQRAAGAPSDVGAPSESTEGTPGTADPDFSGDASTDEWADPVDIGSDDDAIADVGSDDTTMTDNAATAIRDDDVDAGADITAAGADADDSASDDEGPVQESA